MKSSLGKKIVSIMLILMLVVTSVFTFGTVTANATTKTQSDAVNWACARGNEGWCQDVDNYAGCQCVDLIRAYSQYLEGYQLSGSAKDFISKTSLPSGWTREYSNPKPGDVVVWGAGAKMGWSPLNTEYADSVNGHIGIVWRVNASGTISTIETNTLNSKAASYHERYVNNVACFIRPNFSGGVPVVQSGYLNLGDSFNAVILRTDKWVPLLSHNTALGVEGANAKSRWIFKRQSNGAYVITSVYNGQVLDVANGGSTDGTMIGTFPRWVDSSGSNPAQEWYIYASGAAYRFVPRCAPKKSMTCVGSSSAVGTKMNLQAWSDSKAQVFSIYGFPSDIFPTGVSASAKTIKTGETTKLSYTITPSNTSEKFKGVSYSSSNTNVVTVASDGTLRGINPGTANVTVTLKFSDKISAKAKITVQKCQHNYGAYKTTSKATFTKKGVQTSTCVNKNCTAKKTKSIPALKTPTLSATTYTFNNKVKTPTVTVKNTSGTKIEKSVSYASGRKSVGKYAVKVTVNTAYYKDTKTLYFKINPAGKSISKVTPSKKAFTVKWSKPSSTYRKQMTGYQIRYSTSSKMSKAKTVTVKGTKATSKKISKLKAKKTYYVQLRSYKTVKGTTYYSSWSKVKKVKTK